MQVFLSKGAESGRKKRGQSGGGWDEGEDTRERKLATKLPLQRERSEWETGAWAGGKAA